MVPPHPPIRGGRRPRMALVFLLLVLVSSRLPIMEAMIQMYSFNAYRGSFLKVNVTKQTELSVINTTITSGKK